MLKVWAGRFAMVLGAPLLMLMILEFVLWVFDIAADAPPKDPFQRTRVPYDARLEQPLARPRLVCLGGSTVAGAPMEHQLNLCTLAAESMGAELVNMAGSALDSTDVLKRAKVACATRHTMVLVYTGHNEILHTRQYGLGDPGAAALGLDGSLRRFRFYRLIRSWTATAAKPRRLSIDTAAHVATLKSNLQGIVDACGTQNLVLSTVIAHPSIGFLDRQGSVREAMREGGSAPVPLSQPCPQCLRAFPETNGLVRELANAREVALLDAEGLVRRMPAADHDKFWDRVHPMPAVHLLLANELLGIGRARGWIGAGPSAQLTVPPSRWEGAMVSSAALNVQFDPAYAMRQVATLTGPSASRGLVTAVAGFVMDDPEIQTAGLTMLNTALKGDSAPPQLPWRLGTIVNGAEKLELMDAARAVGGQRLARWLDGL